MVSYFREAILAASKTPDLDLGSVVDTEYGIGIVVGLSTPFNGLYLQPELSEVKVWYGTAHGISKFVSKTWFINEVNVCDGKVIEELIR